MSPPDTLYRRFQGKVITALTSLQADGVIPQDASLKNVSVEPPRDPNHGDLATNAAMVLAKQAKTKPLSLAESIITKLQGDEDVVHAEIAGPGFINLYLEPRVWLSELEIIAKHGKNYGRSSMGDGLRVNVEYVSANPTGPMHMGHCRGAVVGDALSSLLEFSGFNVTREYYINDAGGQIDILAKSAHLRYCQALGKDIGTIPEGLYPGDYLVPVGEKLAQQFGDLYLDKPQADWLSAFRKAAVDEMMEIIKSDLETLGIRHDIFSSEAELHASGKPAEAEDWLREKGLVYDGILEAPKGKIVEDWEPIELPLFRSTHFGDDQDRPIKKADGSWTYFGADLAYHLQKANASDALINIWGADHSGTVKRIKAAVSALTQGIGREVLFDVKLVQMVQLMRGGEPVKMSKRSGNFVTISDMVDEVGRDVVRFSMLTRKPEAQMDFDFKKVIEASKDNPVFYVQYAHARICSTIRNALKQGLSSSPDNIALLGDEEVALIRHAARFPREVEIAAKAREPHRIAFYLNELSASFHSYWNLGNEDPEKRFIVGTNAQLSQARLFLAFQFGQVIRNGLQVLGVEAVEEM